MNVLKIIFNVSVWGFCDLLVSFTTCTNTCIYKYRPLKLLKTCFIFQTDMPRSICPLPTG